MANLPALFLVLLTATTTTTYTSAMSLPRQSSSDWHFRLYPLTTCQAPTTGTVTSCYDLQGDLSLTSSCLDDSVRTGEASYFVDWQSFQMLSLSQTFVQRNCSIRFYTTDNAADYSCEPSWYVGEIAATGDGGKCHAPTLPGSAEGRGISSYEVVCSK